MWNLWEIWIKLNFVGIYHYLKSKLLMHQINIKVINSWIKNLTSNLYILWWTCFLILYQFIVLYIDSSRFEKESLRYQWHQILHYKKLKTSNSWDRLSSLDFFSKGHEKEPYKWLLQKQIVIPQQTLVQISLVEHSLCLH